MTDRAVELHAMYLAHCKNCERAGVAAPSPEEWVALLDEHLYDASRDSEWREQHKRDRH
jgi:hypothetical protein